MVKKLKLQKNGKLHGEERLLRKVIKEAVLVGHSVIFWVGEKKRMITNPGDVEELKGAIRPHVQHYLQNQHQATT